MTVERTEVRIEVSGEQQAKAAADSLQREMTDLESRARRAGDAVQGADRGADRGANAWLQRLKDRGVLKRSGVEYGALELTSGGLGLNRGFFRGAGGGAGLAFAAVMGTGILVRGTSSVANTAVDAYQFYKEAGFFGVTDAAKRAFAEKTLGAVGFDSAAKAAWRVAGMFQGVARSSEQAEQAFGEVMHNAWGRGPSDLDRDLDAQSARMRELKAKLAEQEDAERLLAEERRRRRDEQLTAADAEIDRNSRGLKATTPTIGLGRRLAAKYHALEEDGRKLVAELRKERLRKLLPNEGD